MTANGIFQIALYFIMVFALTRPFGAYLARVYSGERTFMHPFLRPLEKLIYRTCRVREAEEHGWLTYSGAMLLFSFIGLAAAYVIQRVQGHLPLNPQAFGTASAPNNATPMTPELAFNTAASFATNTNWQAYVPETTMSYLTQMLGLATHNFMSAATGMSVAVAVTRGFARQTTDKLGNFWVDMVRSTVYVLLPFSLAAALILVSQGVVQNFHAYVTASTLAGGTQTIAQGPVASQEAIKMLGTNGGGFFNANSAHPYENPTPFTNLLQMVMIFAIPAAMTYMFGIMVGDTRQGWALFAAMSILFLAGTFLTYGSEQAGNPILADAGIQMTSGAGQTGGNMEGKEVRFGIAASALFSVITTSASCGAVNAMLDSFTPLGGLVPLVNIELGEVIFGGVGAGLYGILMFAVLSVFIAGLMVGRTPEYLGKKIEQKEVKMAMLAVLILSAGILLTAGLAAVARFPGGSWINPPGPPAANASNAGPHGLTEILYAFSSAAGNNGSAFAGLSANTFFYNTVLGIVMLAGRFLMIIPLLAMAGSLARKKLVPPSLGTLPTDGGLFVALLTAVIIIVGALTFFPALALGPVVEHFMMTGRKLASLPVHSLWS
jgi:potassium-transporting ATPase potassium-binding subunit